MLLIVFISLVIVILILLLHYNQHFKCKYRKCANGGRVRGPSLSSSHHRGESAAKIIEEQMEKLKRSHCKVRCCCVLLTADNEEFDFFPISFLFYLLFMMILYILIIIAQFIKYCDPTNNESMIDLLFAYSLTSYHNNSLSAIHHFTVVHAIDYILIYSVLILALWSSLFSFYRYYTTFISTTTFKVVSTKKLFSKYSIYAVVFSIMFILQIHLYYYLFPINIILYCSFKFYCAYKFSDLLVKQYKQFQNMGLERFPSSNEDVLQSVRFSKNTSLICSILQSLNLCLFVITYNVSIIYYLPILLNISAFILSLNFVRNRKFVSKSLSLKQHCKCIYYKKVKAKLAHSTTSTRMPLNGVKEMDINNVKIEVKADQIKTMIDEDFIMSKPTLNIFSNVSKSADLPTDKAPPIALKPTRSLPLENKKITSNFRVNLIPKIKIQRSPRKSQRKQKALDLLGIPPTPSFIPTPVSMSVRSNFTPSKASMKGFTPNPRLSAQSLLGKASKSNSQQSYTVEDDSDEEKTPEPQSKTAPTPLEIPLSVLEPNRCEDDVDDINETPKISNNPRQSETIDEMIVSLNVLANYGFCSRKSINAMAQLTRYQNTINTQTLDFYETEFENDI